MLKTQKMSEAYNLEKKILEMKEALDVFKDEKYLFSIECKEVGLNQTNLKNLLFKLNNEWINKNIRLVIENLILDEADKLNKLLQEIKIELNTNDR